MNTYEVDHVNHFLIAATVASEHGFRGTEAALIRIAESPICPLEIRYSQIQRILRRLREYDQPQHGPAGRAQGEVSTGPRYPGANGMSLLSDCAAPRARI